MIPGILASMLLGSASAHKGQFFYVGSNSNISNVYTGTNQFLRSADGLNWSTVTPPWTGPVSGRILFGNGRFLISGTDVNGLRIATSPDGITWTSEATPWQGVPHTAVGWQGASQFYGWNGSQSYGNGVFVLVSYDLVGSTPVPRIASSPDGVTWTLRNVPWAAGQMDDVKFANGKFVAIGWDSNAKQTKTVVSADGVTWTAGGVLPWLAFYPNSRITNGNGLWLAAGGPNNVASAASSPDGITWTKLTLPSNTTGGGSSGAWGQVTHAKFVNGAFYVLGTTYSGGAAAVGVIATTVNGSSWSVQYVTSLSSDAINGLAFNAGLFVIGASTAIDQTGRVALAKSTDGVNFTPETTTPLASTGICFNVEFV